MEYGPVTAFFVPRLLDPGDPEKLVGGFLAVTSPSTRSCRIKSGRLPTQARPQTAEVRYTPWDGRARVQVSYSQRIPLREELNIKHRLFEAVDWHYTSGSFDAESMVRVAYDCLTFSRARPEDVSAAVKEAGLTNALAAVGRFSSTDDIAYRALWSNLILHYIVTPTHVLEMLPFSPVEVGWDGVHLADGVAQTYPRPWPNHGFFATIDGITISTEKRHSQLDLPPDLLPSRTSAVVRSRAQSPVERAVAQLPGEVTRPRHKRDDPSKPAFYKHTDNPACEWPDIEQVHRKLHEYCLKRGHPERKWIGFESELGIASYRPDDAWYLACELSGALMTQPFRSSEARATSDGTMQFSVDILLASRFGGYRGGAPAGTRRWENRCLCRRPTLRRPPKRTRAS